MRTFIILGCLMAAANAASLGYNYGPGVSSSTVQTVGSSGFGNSGNLVGSGVGLLNSGGKLSGSGLISSGGSYSSGSSLVGSGSGLIGSVGGLVGSGGSQISSGNSGLLSSGGSYGSGSALIGSGGGLVNSGANLLSSGNSGLVSGSYGSGSNLIGSGGGLISSGNSGFIGNSGSFGSSSKVIDIGSLDAIPQTVELSKQFFHFSAPEEIHDEGQVTQQLSNVLKKNLQVIFITAPENNVATNAALQLAKQAIEQKTSIYVLTKQNDGAQLVGQIQQIQESVPSVPEVRFIKYRTPEDFAHAKQVIQTQYNSIGGTSEVVDGGVAPVLDYASPAKSVAGATLLGSSAISTGSGGVSNLGSNSGSFVGSGVVSGLGSSNGSIVGSGVVSGLGSLINKNVGGVNVVSGGTSSSYLPSNPL